MTKDDTSEISERTKNTAELIDAFEVANYVVCPEAWRLKNLTSKAVTKETKQRSESSERRNEAKRIRVEWAKEQDLSTTLRYYAKIVYMLLVALVIVVFLIDQRRVFSSKIRESQKQPISQQKESPANAETERPSSTQ